MTFAEQVPVRLRFKVNPIKIVVAQVRIPHSYTLARPETLAEVQSRLSRYPDPVAPAEIQVTVEQGQSPAISHGAARFRSEDAMWLVSIAPDAISLETTDYLHWEDFRERFGEMLDALREFLPSRSTRVGLRYVNEVSVSGVEAATQWRPLLRPEMTGLSAGDWVGPTVKRSFQQINMQVGDDQVTLRHGYIGRDQLPEEAPPSVYLIDVDVFTQRPADIEVVELLARLDRYHLLAWSLFRGSISEALVEVLGGEPQ